MRLQTGDRLDHYRIDGLVARSGMASGISRRTSKRVELNRFFCHRQFALTYHLKPSS